MREVTCCPLGGEHSHLDLTRLWPLDPGESRPLPPQQLHPGSRHQRHLSPPVPGPQVDNIAST